MDYSREEIHTAATDAKVYNLLCKAGISDSVANNAMALLKMHGILFRERKCQ